MQGNAKVEQYMYNVSKAIDRHVKDANARTDIYNRAYEAVQQAIKDQQVESKLNVLMRPAGG